ncbi:MAG: phospholipid carrier-dependent glycosyltransferase, partial [Candidatus Jacksonbacteria bacterium]|nr:phospholipid carrier-dependent glycosyltransferase [Candidatus Jacksonbacteria bacterium]
MKSSMTIFRDIFSNYKEWVLVVGILVVSFVVFFEQIHVPVFFPDVDEAIYAQSALESIQNKTPFIPIWYGDPFFDKPPLGYLIIQSGYKIFGENTFGARAGVAFTGVLAMIIFYYLGKEFFGRKLIAFFAVLALLATDSMYFHVFRSADFDGPLLLFF